MSDITYTFAIVAGIVVLFVWDRLPVVVVALAAALALWATGVVDLGQALSGFGDPAVTFIASLFVVSGALDATGVTAWTGQALIARAGESRVRLLVLMMLLVAILTALINLNGSVAALLPVVVVMAVRLGRPPSQLLMPLVFAGHAGSLLALTGTPVNVLVSDAVADAGFAPYGYFEFAWVGLPLLLGTMAIILLLGPRLLPNRSGKTIPADLSKHARTLVEHYTLKDDVFQLRVRSDSLYRGVLRAGVDLGDYPGISLVAMQGVEGGPLRRPVLGEGDMILVRGDAQTVARLATDKHLALRSENDGGDVASTLLNNRSGLAEVVIPPRSIYIGETMFPGMLTPSGDLVVLAIRRNGETLGPGEAVVREGDTLLLQGTWKALDEQLGQSDVLVVDSPELVRRQAVPMGPGAKQAIAVLAAMVVLLMTGFVPPAVAGLLAAGALIVSGVVTVEQAYRSINWTTIILIGAMMPLSTAMYQSGAAVMLGEGLVRTVGEAGPYALLAGLFLLTGILGQLISNTATALVIIPIAVAAAQQLGISARPVLMSVNVAAAASFLTPVATPVNLMVMGPGGYRFGDYWKLGLPLMIWFFVMSVFYVPLVWRL
ncbi:MAG: SLC13 family permease [Geminicoccaceae bacterium]